MAIVPPRSYSKPSVSNPTMSLGIASRRTGRLIASSAPASLGGGCRPRYAFWREGLFSRSRAYIPYEVFRGRALSAVELAVIRLQVESIDTMEQIDDETRALIIRHWPDIADKLPPKP